MKRKKRTWIIAGSILVIILLAWTTNFHMHITAALLSWAVGGDRNGEGYSVSFSADDMYSVEHFTLRSQYSEFSVGKGILVPGTTEVGVTVVLVLGDGEWTVQEPGKYAWRHLHPEPGDGPLKEHFTSLYLRIHPRFYEHLLAGATIKKIRDSEIFREAERIYRHKFWNSYHANEKALIPSTDIGTIDMESVTWGRLQVQEEFRLGPVTREPQVIHWDYEGDPPWYMH